MSSTWVGRVAHSGFTGEATPQQGLALPQLMHTSHDNETVTEQKESHQSEQECSHGPALQYFPIRGDTAHAHLS